MQLFIVLSTAAFLHWVSMLVAMHITELPKEPGHSDKDEDWLADDPDHKTCKLYLASPEYLARKG